MSAVRMRNAELPDLARIVQDISTWLGMAGNIPARFEIQRFGGMWADMGKTCSRTLIFNVFCDRKEFVT